MRTLTPAQRRALRARAHHLDAFASVGQAGLSPSVLHEIDVSLRAHELVKIRVFAAEREARDAMLTQICEALDAAPVQHLGKVLIVWRPAPKEEVAPPPARTRSAAKRQPQARRPRSPMPRTPARPAPVAPPAPRGKGRRGAARHDPSLGRDPDLTGPPGATRRKSTYTPKTTPKSFSAKPNPRSAWEKKPPAPRGGKPAGTRTSSGKPRGGKPLGFARAGAKPASTMRGARPASTASAAGARRRRKAP
jgi:putative YhbY family RNA-binding protein